MLEVFPHGKFLAEGGYKKVYRVRNAAFNNRIEAMSILDLKSLRSRGLDEQLGTELWVSFLLGQLASSNKCPHFLKLHQLFKSAQAPVGDEWGGAFSFEEGCAEESAVTGNASAAPKPRRGNSKNKNAGPCYQYVMMEFADGGDMEEACKLQQGNKMMWPTERLAPMLYQMLFSMYAAQKELTLRHYDVKLLNFFLKTPTIDEPVDISDDTGSASSQTMSIRYGVLGRSHRFELPTDEPSLCVLADFGTADINPSTLHQRITTQHFTTLENTPPDFLLLGNHAVQDYQADAFALGLCWLHMLTGRAPYEELLASCKCPPELMKALDAVWLTIPDDADTSPGALGWQYKPVKKLIDGDDDEENVLYHTLYRFLCLFGPADDQGEEEADEEAAKVVAAAAKSREGSSSAICDSDAWKAVRKWLDTTSGRKAFAKDRKEYSAFTGKNKHLVEAQKRMAKVPGSKAMLRGLTLFDPSKRWSIKAGLASKMFDAYGCGKMERATHAFVDYLGDK